MLAAQELVCRRLQRPETNAAVRRLPLRPYTMQDHLKHAFAEQEPVTGSWLSIGHPAVAEVSATVGVDFVLVDIEHTPINLDTVSNVTRAVTAADGDTETVVRISSHDPSEIQCALDIGISGIMVPRVDSAEQARELVESARYPPEGRRGLAGGRAAEYGLSFQEYVSHANDNVVVIVQIETREGFDNVDEIAAVDAIDALFVGPADLSGSLGLFGEWDSEQFNEALVDIVEAGHAEDVPVGTLTVASDDISRRVDQGFDFLIVGKDAAFIAEGTREAVQIYHQAVWSTSDSLPVDED